MPPRNCDLHPRNFLKHNNRHQFEVASTVARKHTENAFKWKCALRTNSGTEGPAPMQDTNAHAFPTTTYANLQTIKQEEQNAGSPGPYSHAALTAHLFGRRVRPLLPL